ncbi:MAG: translation initiation factor IF-3 [Ruminococcaceae bacterium]|nr:translation initiation factor IF-3 [Oscillospiraceae bacterium]
MAGAVRRRAGLANKFHHYGRRCFPIASGKKDRDLEINGQIREKEVRVIDADGSQLGVMQTRDAMKLAEDRDLDLVKIAPQANPPVVKVLDYGKYRFELQKKEKEARKNQKTVEIKEIRLSLKIDTNDFNTKVGHAARFLKAGDKVKVTIRFRGREMAHPRQGLEVHRRFAEALPEATIERAPKLEGRSMIMFLAPEKEKEPPKAPKKPKPDAGAKPQAEAKPADAVPQGEAQPAKPAEEAPKADT